MEINAYVRETILKCPYPSPRCQRKYIFFNHIERNQGSANRLEVKINKKRSIQIALSIPLVSVSYNNTMQPSLHRDTTVLIKYTAPPRYPRSKNGEKTKIR